MPSLYPILVRAAAGAIGTAIVLAVATAAAGGGVTLFADLVFVAAALSCGVAALLSRPTALSRSKAKDVEREEAADSAGPRSAGDLETDAEPETTSGVRIRRALTFGVAGLLLIGLLTVLYLAGAL